MAAGFPPPLGTRAQALSRGRWGWLAIGGRVGHLAGEVKCTGFVGERFM
jgi:hypothetical protein